MLRRHYHVYLRRYKCLTDSVLSTDVGSIEPRQSRSQSVSPEMGYKISESLRTLQDANRCTVTILYDEPNRLDALEPSQATTTTSDIVYYVNPSGSDLNSGSSTSPFKTLAKAIKEVPLFHAHSVTINLSAGTHTIDTELLIGGIQLSRSIDFKIQGAGFQSVTPTTGVASGTFTSASDWTLNMTGAGWTASDLIGKFVKITSGSSNGDIYPIAGNAETALEVGKKVLTTAATATFEIVEPTTVLAFSGNGSLSVSTSQFTRGAYFSSTTPATGVILASLKMTSTASRHLINAASGAALVLNGVSAKAKEGYRCINACSLRIVLNNTYLGARSSRVIENSGGIQTSLITSLCVIDSLGYASSGYSINASSGGATLSNTIVQNLSGASSFGIYASTGSLQYTWIRNCVGTALSLGGNGPFSFNASKISNITGVGIQVYSGHQYMSAAGPLVIDTCSSHGIYSPVPGTIISMTGLTITNCGGYGILLTSLTGVNVGSMNTVFLSGTVTMSGNTSGDFCLDGTTAVSYATLAADPDKTIVDAARFNRISLA